MPRKKGSNRALNLRAYQQRRASERATHAGSDSQTPASPEPPMTPPEVTFPPSIASEAPPPNTPCFSSHIPPPPKLIKCVIPELEERVNPKRTSGIGHKKSKLSPLALKDLSSASLSVSTAKGHGKGHAQILRAWGRAYLVDPTFIPRTSYGHSQEPLIEYDEFRADLQDYLRSVGKYITASSLDEHEREDVVEYRQNTCLKKWKEMEPRMQSYARVEFEYTYMDPIIRRIVVWYHDECTFSAHNKRLLLWILLSASPEPSKKGEGRALMVSDLISADYGWLRSPDRNDRTREFFKAGAGRQEYFSTEHVCKQITHVVDILAEHYTGEDHVIVFDNSPTHKKRGADAPSAQQMPKFTPKEGAKNFLVQTTDEAGNMVEVPITGGYFSDGSPQSFYWPEGHSRAGWFKGMAEILKERGWENAYSINAKCKECDKSRTDCCLRRILYNEPDFANPTSILERLVTSRGVGFLLLPKLHPELNPIEMCWGRAKRAYREFPEPKGEIQLQKYVEAALDSVSLEDIRRREVFVGLNMNYLPQNLRKASAPAPKGYAMAKRYHGHRVYPEKILAETEELLRQGKDGPKGVRARL
ncbi:hypothetical protein CTheo_8030 [Ceratobasidium theobromae]|uniref:DDE family endonuclease n=1 Tax=Ceratobasidium theobromae TaxID=1582974 RepID=A0A5N5QA79_9AGAM|nr:hypothetical protein CTheo_8030 [Ceratobasidium theobromae]